MTTIWELENFTSIFFPQLPEEQTGMDAGRKEMSLFFSISKTEAEIYFL